ncbi:hypothetical protein J6590_006873 [Homalodisca vitripennis]|nr:hypothetical protein J6590_006873 [Homalodisca vitripennis]
MISSGSGNVHTAAVVGQCQAGTFPSIRVSSNRRVYVICLVVNVMVDLAPARVSVTQSGMARHVRDGNVASSGPDQTWPAISGCLDCRRIITPPLPLPPQSKKAIYFPSLRVDLSFMLRQTLVFIANLLLIPPLLAHYLVSSAPPVFLLVLVSSFRNWSIALTLCGFLPTVLPHLL